MFDFVHVILLVTMLCSESLVFKDLICFVYYALIYLLHYFFVFFFFFKQKTAYEMRISDWSSDVCSSDLNGRDAGGREPRDCDCRARDRRRHGPERARTRSQGRQKSDSCDRQVQRRSARPRSRIAAYRRGVGH